MCTNCQKNNCGCQPEPTFSLCNPLCPPEPCTCPVVDLSTDCIVLAQDLECSGVLAGTVFTEAVQQLDEYICTAIAELIASINLINVGTGAQIYKGVDGIGRKELKTITSDGSIVITPSTNEIQLSVSLPELQDLQSVLDTGNTATQGTTGSYEMTDQYFKASITINPGANMQTGGFDVGGNVVQMGGSYGHDGIFDIGSVTLSGGILELRQQIDFANNKKIRVGFETPLYNDVNLLFPNGTGSGTRVLATVDQIPTIDGSETKISNGTNTTVTGNGTIATPYQIAVNGSETKVNAGTNVTITGNGTTATPYIINSIATGASTVINAGTNISVTGAGTSGSPFVISNTQVIDGSETKLNSGITTVVTGNGTTATPYTVETVNLQKAITANYTVLAADNNYSIKINNGATPITITVPAGLPLNFFAGFTQKGTADVTFVGSGTTITNPIGLKIKGQGYAVGLEQIGTSNSFDLIADTKA